MSNFFMYHAAPVCVRQDIEEEGLRGFADEIYAAETAEEAFAFMALRLTYHHHGSIDLQLPSGDTVLVPDIVEHGELDVWEIDARRTGKWLPSTDHLVDARAWRHEGSIARRHLVSRTTMRVDLPVS